jgi:hypothetical protein
MLPATGTPLLSMNGSGFPGLYILSTIIRARIIIARTEMVINIIRETVFTK